MLRPRLIPVVLLKHGQVVRSQLFHIHQVIGNPVNTVRRLSNWNVDELILLDISETDYHDLRREDLHVRYDDTGTLSLLGQIADVCFMPLAFGGRVASIDDMEQRLALGADKCVLKHQCIP